MKKNFTRYVVIFILCMLGIIGCSNSTQKQNPEEVQINNIELETDNIIDTSTTSMSQLSYEMRLYTEAPNKDSSIKIQYPVFSGYKAEEINTIILTKVLDMAWLDPLRMPKDPKFILDYQATVTLQNSKMISIVFWGTSDLEGNQFPTTGLYSLNIDMQSLKLITFNDLYTVNKDFEKTFFEKAFFPSEPVTSYNEELFPEMLKFQTPEYRLPGPFSIPESILCFFKPEGIVLSMSAVHASGSDHFEAELLYSDIQEYYLPEKIYWEE